MQFHPIQLGTLCPRFSPSNVLSHGLVLILGAPYSLKQLGFKEEDIEKAAEIAAKAPYPNPVPLEKEGILHLLRNAWAGNNPSAK